MARITPETLDHVARLARLALTPEERQTFARQLESILEYASKLESLATDDVPPMSHAGAAGALREDVERPGLAPGQALEPAPDASDGLFRVPKVIPD
jgi:aspartyl-tRNA(Asn)/glutamyl-tRNA(Gln) amidotransferase subunit C